MEDLYMLLLIVGGLIVYDGIKYVWTRFKRRWGENPSDATYGGKS